MKDFYERNARVWVKVTRRADKSFVFSTGYAGQFEAFDVRHYSHAFMPTIKDARAMARTKATDYA